jgi:hypothetical protein
MKEDSAESSSFAAESVRFFYSRFVALLLDAVSIIHQVCPGASVVIRGCGRATIARLREECACD